VLVPCHNEEAAIATVVRDFLAVLPGAIVYVYDNNSTDRTVERARAAGALVRYETLQGKGNVVRRMFADVEADIYVLVDGDDTYHAPSAVPMIKRLLADRLDVVNATRLADTTAAYRPGHRFGNAMLSRIVAAVFGARITDTLSGYRALSRRFVKTFPAMSVGFETETELTVHALELRMPIGEIPVPYKERRSGSSSKLRTVRDGVRILRTILALVKGERPLPFFGAMAAAFAFAGVALGWPVVVEYMNTGLVPRLPTAVLATGLVILSSLSLACGLILDTITLGRREMKRLRYLAMPTLEPVDPYVGSSPE
jgi:glycosyltransferase involved in cell wall biosynthesis